MKNIIKIFIGCEFESEISRNIKSFLPKKRIVRSLPVYSFTLRKLMEIDILLITSFGIYCIEAKYISGKLCGSINDTMWRNKKYNHCTYLFNPFIQNNEHIRSLRAMLRLKGYKPPVIESIICIPNGKLYNSECNNIYTVGNLLCKLEKDMRSREHTIDIDEFYQQLKSLEEIL